jgi:alanine dehydrogenase
VAAKYLARDDAKAPTICGCGAQERIQLRALSKVPALERVYTFDLDYARAERFAREFSDELRIESRPVHGLTTAVRDSDICVTCAPSRQSYLCRDIVAPGTFIAAVGADREEKQEPDPRPFAESKIVVDLLGQCGTIGDLHHALGQGVVTRASVQAELAEVVVGAKTVPTSQDEIIIFDSTGTAVQDAAAAELMCEKAVVAGIYPRFNFAM